MSTQVTNLSAELAAERLVSEEARQQVTLLGAETARLQAQVASLQRAVGTSFTGKQSPQIGTLQDSMKHNISHKEDTVAGSPNLSHKLFLFLLTSLPVLLIKHLHCPAVIQRAS